MPPSVSIRIASHQPHRLHTLLLAMRPSQGCANPLIFRLSSPITRITAARPFPFAFSWSLAEPFSDAYPCRLSTSPKPFRRATSAATLTASSETASARTTKSSWASCCSRVPSRRWMAGRALSACSKASGRRAGGCRDLGVLSSGRRQW